MDTANMLRLVVLAAILGSSALFMRIAAPVLGSPVLIEYRVAIAALFLALVAWTYRLRGAARPLALRRHWKHYLIIGVFNSALPFLLVAFAAHTLSASLLSVLNATAPMWGALVGAVWGGQKVTKQIGFGLVVGVGGVALLVGFDSMAQEPGAGLAVAATVAATLSYALATQYVNSVQEKEDAPTPFANAHGSMWGAALVVLPLAILFPAPQETTPGIAGAVLALAIVCTGVAYLIYFRLLDDVGATSTLTATFLSPVFGILCGALFLDEPVGWHTVAGSAIVLLGTALVTGFRPHIKRAPATAAD